MKRIMVYSHDTFGLGNIRRMLTVAMHLEDAFPDASVLIVSGSPMLHAFRIPPRVDYLKLPCLSRTQAGDYAVKFLDMPFDETVRLRSNLLVSAILDFEPDLIVVDKKPLGVGNELEHALELLQRRGRQTRLALLLRDILDSPEATRAVWSKNGYFDAIDRYYDQVLVVGSEHVFDLAREYDFPASVRDKVRYCGYLKRERHSAARTLQDGPVTQAERLVLVTTGGGEDGHRLISAYADSLDAIAAAGSVHSVVVCGPEMSPVHRKQVSIRLEGRDDVTLLEFSDDMMGLMDAADLVVSMSGYNTVCELLSLRKRAILVPRVKPVAEQWIRAERLEQLGLMRALHPDRLTPESLAAMVTQELDLANVVRYPRTHLDMDGLDRICDSLGELLDTSAVRVAGARATMIQGVRS